VSRPLAGPWPKDVDGEIRVVVPQKALGELSRMAEEIGGEIVFSREENQMFFEMGRCMLTSKLLEGQFPNFEKVLPKGNDKIIDGRIPSETLEAVSLLSSERNRAVVALGQAS
jgi:DNA polymerase-3 subunit beta